MVAIPLCLPLSWLELCLWIMSYRAHPMLWLGRAAFSEQHICLPSKKYSLVDLKPSGFRSNLVRGNISGWTQVEVPISPVAQWPRGGDMYRMWLAQFNFCLYHRKLGDDRGKPRFPLLSLVKQGNLQAMLRHRLRRSLSVPLAQTVALK